MKVDVYLRWTEVSKHPIYMGEAEHGEVGESLRLWLVDLLNRRVFEPMFELKLQRPWDQGHRAAVSFTVLNEPVDGD